MGMIQKRDANNVRGRRSQRLDLGSVAQVIRGRGETQLQLRRGGDGPLARRK
jgi:hypothetical protein